MTSRFIDVATFAAVTLQVFVGATFFGALGMIALTSFSIIPQPY